MYTKQISIMNLQTANDLVLFLQDMAADTNNTPDLELATDYLESQDVEITDAVIADVQELLFLNF